MASQTDVAAEAPQPPGYVAGIMMAIAACQAALTTKIEAVQLEIGLMRQDVDKLRCRVFETKLLVGTVEDAVWEHSSALCTIQNKIKALEY